MVNDAVGGAPVLLEHAVQPAELDRFGFAAPTEQVHWCEVARDEYCRKVGLDGRLLPPRVGAIVSSHSLHFHRAVGYPDSVIVGVRATRVGSRSVTFQVRVVSRATGKLVADGSEVLLLFDYDQNRTVEIPPTVRREIDRLERGGPASRVRMDSAEDPLEGCPRLLPTPERDPNESFDRASDRLLRSLARKDPEGLLRLAREEGLDLACVERLIHDVHGQAVGRR